MLQLELSLLEIILLTWFVSFSVIMVLTIMLDEEIGAKSALALFVFLPLCIVIAAVEVLYGLTIGTIVKLVKERNADKREIVTLKRQLDEYTATKCEVGKE